jgi:hypothetical protein
MSLLFLFLACGESYESPAGPSAQGVSEYTQGMWGERTRTVQAGLEEAAALATEERSEEAAALLVAIYEGSFEPELEWVIRRDLGAQEAMVLEFQFGRLRQALEQGGDVASQVATLMESLNQTAALLDEKQVVWP